MTGTTSTYEEWRTKLEHELAERNHSDLAKCTRELYGRVTKILVVTFVAGFGMTVAVLGAVLYLFLHIVRQPQPRVRPQGMHFATLILSPFTPVIEHEPSAAAMNVQLLVLLLLAAGLAVFVWFQGSSPRRK